MAYTLTVALALGSSQTGLTLSAQLVDTTGANVGSAVATGFVEFALGYYQWTYASFPDGFRGCVKFSSSGTLKTVCPINPEEAEYTDTKTSTRASASSLTTVSVLVDDLEGRLTSQRATNLDNLDVAISSRLASAGYTAPDNASVTAIKAKTDQLAFSSGDVIATLNGETVAVGDKTGYSLSPAGIADVAAAIDLSTIESALATINGLVDDLETRVTAQRAANLDNIATAPPSASAIVAALDSGSADLDTIITSLNTLLTRLSAIRASNLDNVDVVVSTRLASASYVAPSNAAIAAIQAKTDQLTFIDGDVVATLDGEEVTTGEAGAGGIAYTYTLTDSTTGQPIDGVAVWVTTSPTNPALGVQANETTSASGQVTFMLEAGTYYLWRQRAGYNFANPQTITVSA